MRRLVTQTDGSARGPLRTCIGCGKRDARAALLRLSQVEGSAVVVDPAKSSPGRGAWLHPSWECFDKARKSRRITRALRLTDGVSWQAVKDFFAAEGIGDRPHNDESGLEADGHPMSTQR